MERAAAPATWTSLQLDERGRGKRERERWQILALSMVCYGVHQLSLTPAVSCRLMTRESFLFLLEARVRCVTSCLGWWCATRRSS